MTSSHDLRRALDGICGILITPFDARDKLAPEALGPIVQGAVDAGVHTLVTNGNTSEFYSLSLIEAQEMVHAAAAHVAGRVPLIGGVGRNVHDACALARTSRQAGATAVMVHQLMDPFVAPSGILRYVHAVADAAGGLPLVLYLRDDTIGVPAIEELCRIPQVVGMKWAAPTPLRLAEVRTRVADRDLAWVCGLAEPWAAPMYAVGARGFTSGLINVHPGHSKRIHEALEQGNYAQAGRLVDDMAAFERLRSEDRSGANVSVVKSALRLIGRDCGAARPPATWPLRPASAATLERLLARWGLCNRSAAFGA